MALLVLWLLRYVRTNANSGDSLVLSWKAIDKDCEIKFQEINIDLAIRACDTSTEQCPVCDDGPSPSLPPAIEVRQSRH